jgi:hypothetical protein
MDVVDDSYAGAAGSVTSSRKYYRFSAGSEEGETDYYVAAQLPLDRAKTTSDTITVLDRRVLADYGRKLLPRAIGYSVATIDHFFRGKIEIAPPARHVFGRAAYAEGNTTSFPTLRFQVRNESPPNQETSGTGKIWAVVHYRTASENLFDNPRATLSASNYLVSAEQPVPLTRSFQELRFDFPNGGIPANSGDVWLTVVYQGDLGGEPNAVLVGGLDLAEPTPIDYANLTDYDCVNEQPYYVGNLPPGDPARDLGDATLIGPYLERNQYQKGANGPLYTNLPSSANFDYFLEEVAVTGGATIADGVTPTTRFVVLTDYSDLWFTDLTEEVRNENDDLLTQNLVHAANNIFYWPNHNDYDRYDPNADGTLDRSYFEVDTYRGVTGYTMVYLPTRASNYFAANCLFQLRNASPNLTRIPGTVAPEET